MEGKPRVALFIDAENVSSEHALESLAVARRLGTVRIARCYGMESAIRDWNEAIATHHLLPVLTPPVTGKPNATDFALTIEAVSLLHGDRFDIALIASSDSDFGLLAMHIREHGKSVCCLGEGSKLKDRHETLYDKVFKYVSTKGIETPTGQPPAEKKTKPLTKPGVEFPINELKSKFADLSKNNGAVALTSFAQYLAKEMPKNYRKGHGTVSNYLKKTGVFEFGKDDTITLKTK